MYKWNSYFLTISISTWTLTVNNSCAMSTCLRIYLIFLWLHVLIFINFFLPLWVVACRFCLLQPLHLWYVDKQWKSPQVRLWSSHRTFCWTNNANENVLSLHMTNPRMKYDYLCLYDNLLISWNQNSMNSIFPYTWCVLETCFWSFSVVILKFSPNVA